MLKQEHDKDIKANHAFEPPSPAETDQGGTTSGLYPWPLPLVAVDCHCLDLFIRGAEKRAPVIVHCDHLRATQHKSRPRGWGTRGWKC